MTAFFIAIFQQISTIAPLLVAQHYQGFMFDIDTIRNDFPALAYHRDNQLVYLDSAATSQKPQCVIDTLNQFYSQQNANVHRGAHRLSQEATTAYERARDKVSAKSVVTSSELRSIFEETLTEQETASEQLRPKYFTVSATSGANELSEIAEDDAKGGIMISAAVGTASSGTHLIDNVMLKI